MEANSAMIGPKPEEDIELELGLSIGGCFKRTEKLNPIKNEAAQFQHTDDPKSSAFDTDLRENYQNCLQLGSKHEIEALRRQEAKKNRQEKEQKKRTSTAAIKNGECINSGCEATHDNKMWLKSSELETKERDCKKSRVEENGPTSNVVMKNANPNFTVEQNINMNQNVAFNSTVCPVMYPYLYPALQYVQFANGLQYPCVNVVPRWAADGAGSGNDQVMVQPMANRSFRSFQSGLNTFHGCVWEQNSRKAGSIGNDSPMCSSSVVSDYRSSSHEGGASSDTRSHSSHSLRERCNGSQPNDTKVQSEHSASSHLMETAQICDGTTNTSMNFNKPKISPNGAQCSPSTKCTTNSMEQKILSNSVQCSATKPHVQAVTKSQTVSPKKPVSTTKNLPPGVLKELKREMGKPPKPQTLNQNTLSIRHMPCVSITGNGPNGKTINGFLYRYTKAEVSIICVCHGTSFSPAEFVQHAGSTDVSQPLKHITVIPSAF